MESKPNFVWSKYKGYTGYKIQGKDLGYESAIRIHEEKNVIWLLKKVNLTLRNNNKFKKRVNQFFWMVNRADKVFEYVWEGTDKLEYRQSL